MPIFEKTVFEVNDDYYDFARGVASNVTEEASKKRIYAVSVALATFLSNISDKKFKPDTDIITNLFKVETFSQEFDIADLYYKGLRFDIRITFNDSYISIPKFHYKKDLLPHLYIGIKLDEKLETVRMLGFIAPDDVNKKNQTLESYFVKQSELTDINELKNYLKNKKPINQKISDADFSFINENKFKFFDKSLSNEEKIKLAKIVLNNKDLRYQFVEANDFEIVTSQINLHENLKKYFEQIEVLENENDSSVIEKIYLNEDINNIEEVIMQNNSTQEILFDELLEEKEKKDKEEFSQLDENNENKDNQDLTEDNEEEITDLENTEDISEENLFDNENIIEILDEKEINSNFELEPINEISEEKDLLEEIKTNDNEKQIEIEDENELIDIEKVNETEFLEDLDNSQEISEIEDSNKMENMVQKMASETASEAVIDITQESKDEENYDEKELILDDKYEQTGELEELDTLENFNFAENENKNEDFIIDLPKLDEIIPEEEEEEEEENEIYELNEEIIENDNRISENKKYDEDEPEIIQSSEYNEDDFLSVEEIEKEITTIQNIDDKNSKTSIDDIDISSIDIEDIDLDDIEISDINIDKKNPINEVKAKEEDIEDLIQIDEATKDIQNNTLAQILNKNVEDEEKSMNELFQEKNVKTTLNSKSEKKSPLILTFLLIVIAITGVSGYLMNKAPSTKELQESDAYSSALSDDLGILGDEPSPTPNQDMDMAITKAMSPEIGILNISKIAWQVNKEDLAINGMKNYLNSAGNKILTNLKQDLINIGEKPLNDKIIINARVKSNNKIENIQITESSGSNKINEVVLRSINKGLSQLIIPKANNSNRIYEFNIIVNF